MNSFRMGKHKNTLVVNQVNTGIPAYHQSLWVLGFLLYPDIFDSFLKGLPDNLSGMLWRCQYQQIIYSLRKISYAGILVPFKTSFRIIRVNRKYVVPDLLQMRNNRSTEAFFIPRSSGHNNRPAIQKLFDVLPCVLFHNVWLLVNVSLI